MTPIVAGLFVFACVFGGALLGIFLRSALPENHLNADSKQIVNLGMGIIGTMAALLSGYWSLRQRRHSTRRAMS
jgi:hypothetical protein